MQSAVADRPATSHNRLDGQKVDTSTNSCRAAAWFNTRLNRTRFSRLRLLSRAG